ncbi:MAG: c-type cytochrome biogenesis protein CcmI [Gammaproteobacteria bacterium]|nr:c-type cytochrome biogenesis protein CcmI [Gammaproteobacteria bacterium]
MFLALLAAVALVAALLALLPAWRSREESADEGRADNLRRLDELEADIAAGDVDQASAALVRAELERAVLSATSATPGPQRRGNRALLGVIVVAVLAGSIPLYQHLGTPRLAEFAITHPGADVAEPRNAVELLLDEVRARTVAVPDDVEAWTVLGRTTLSLGQFDEALAAAEHAHALAPDDVGGMLLLIDALAMRDGGRFGTRARELIGRVRELEPGNVTALVLEGIAFEQDGASAQALAAWRQALAALPPAAPFRHELEMMIAGVGGAPATQPAAAPGPSVARALDVEVRLAPGLGTDLPPDTPVFVLARAPQGPPAPLAVTRLRLAELPAQVRLDDSMAMVPGHNLSAHETVEVLARVSRSGAPQASPGDLEGSVTATTTGENGALDVVIDRVVE